MFRWLLQCVATTVAFTVIAIVVPQRAAHASTIHVDATTSGTIVPDTVAGVTISFTGTNLVADLGPETFLPFGTFHVSGISSSMAAFSSDFELTIAQTSPAANGGVIPGTIEGTIKVFSNTLELSITGGSLVLSGVRYTLFPTNIGGTPMPSVTEVHQTVYGSIAAVPVPLPAAAWAGLSLMGLIWVRTIRKTRELRNELK